MLLFYRNRCVDRRCPDQNGYQASAFPTVPSAVLGIPQKFRLRPVSYTHLDVYKRQAQITEAGIHRGVLQELVKKGEIYQFGRGLYVRSDAWEDDFYLLQLRYASGIYSHDTALYLSLIHI